MANNFSRMPLKKCNIFIKKCCTFFNFMLYYNQDKGDTNMVKSCMIKKIPNGLGNYSCQYIEDNKFKVCSFKTYADAVTYAFMVWDLTKERHLEKSVILERED